MKLSPLTTHKAHPYFRKRRGLLLLIDAMIYRGRLTASKTELREWLFASNTKCARLIKEGEVGGLLIVSRHDVTLRSDWAEYIDLIVGSWHQRQGNLSPESD